MQRVVEHDRLLTWRGAINRPTHVGFTRIPLCEDSAALMVDDWSRMEVAPKFTATYDAWNRLVKLSEPPASAGGGWAPVQENQYDGRGYRIVTKSYTSGTLTETRHAYFTDQWQCVEERLGTSATPDRQFFWGVRYIDDLILRDRSVSGGTLGQPPAADERLYALQDANWNVTTVADSTGTVQERYEYDPYGVTTILAPDFTTRSTSNFAWETTYCGYHWDQSIGLFAVRNRFYHPRLGVWLKRDPYEPASYDNLYQALMGVNAVDPLGLEVAGYNHTWPLFLGGTNSQPLFYMNSQMHTAFHDHLASHLGRRFGNSAQAAFSALTRDQQDELIRGAARAGGMTDDVIAHYWDDITRNVTPGKGRWRFYQSGPRIGGPRPRGAAGRLGQTCLKTGLTVSFSLVLNLDAMAGNAHAEDRMPRQNRMTRCHIRQVTRTETTPNFPYSMFVDPVSSTVPLGEPREAYVWESDLPEMLGVRSHESSLETNIYTRRKWNEFELIDCHEFAPDDECVEFEFGPAPTKNSR